MAEKGGVTRARKHLAPIYCGRLCACFGRRKHKSVVQKRQEKAAYDATYRVDNLAVLKAKKVAYYAANHDREKERIVRQRRMPAHVEYCRRPEYRKTKAGYDRQRRDMEYGEYAECKRLLIDLQDLIMATMPRYEIYQANGYFKRQSERQRNRRKSKCLTF